MKTTFKEYMNELNESRPLFPNVDKTGEDFLSEKPIHRKHINEAWEEFVKKVDKAKVNPKWDLDQRQIKQVDKIIKDFAKLLPRLETLQDLSVIQKDLDKDLIPFFGKRKVRTLRRNFGVAPGIFRKK